IISRGIRIAQIMKHLAILITICTALLFSSCMFARFLEIYPYVTIESSPGDSSKYFFVDSVFKPSTPCTAIAQASGRVFDMDKSILKILKRAKEMNAHAFVIVDPPKDITVRKTFLFQMPGKNRPFGLKEVYFFKGQIVRFSGVENTPPPSPNPAVTDTVKLDGYLK
ncbi:MAG: hypothetical protein ABIA63_02815, partial [bacterium]